MADNHTTTVGGPVPFSHPLFLHPSDTQGASIITHILTGTDNYTVWNRAMRIALRGKQKLGFMDGTCKKEDQDARLQDQWERCNAVVLSWLLNSISKDLANSVIYHHNARPVWVDLQERFDKVTGSRIFALHREITSLRQGPLSVSSYYSKLKELWEEQSVLLPLPSCKCETSKIYGERIQQQRVLQFLLGLNECFHSARSQILMTSPLPSINQVFAMIAENEAQTQILASTP